MKITAIAVAGLLGYSALLIGYEAATSQADVRPYFSDIEDVAPLFGINTTLSTFLLAGTALLLLFAALAGPAAAPLRRRNFLFSQAGIFGFLAADDRFQIHERLGWHLGIADHFVMLGWAMAELAFIAAFWRPRDHCRRATGLFVAGGCLFAVMFTIDAFAPSGAFLRLSLEDLAKSWAAAMFLGFGWVAARDYVQGVPQRTARHSL